MADWLSGIADWFGKNVDVGDVLNVGGALLSNSATNEAIDTQTAAGDKALALQERMYNQSREDLAPYRESGNAANAKLSQLMGLAQPDTGAIKASLLQKYPALFGGGQAPATQAAPAGYGSADSQMLERLQMYAGQGGENGRAAQRLLYDYNLNKDTPDGQVNPYTGQPFSKAEYLAGIQGQLENMAQGKNEGLFSQANREMTPEQMAQRDKVYSSTYRPSESKQGLIYKAAQIAKPFLVGAVLGPGVSGALGAAGAGTTAANLGSKAFSSLVTRGTK